ncbi:single-stranded DNA-binding protein [Pandoraea terrae]|uniref:Single-stranded DNA-binding protein n=1 Tax=Pandoraea terrae TaxID=1537710 RepID=A0A5E4X6M8_9BURK|nr:single-stranded DNA-binding protein [Pandoraea terrae]VVE31994.1 single-stranded DNA-binding protein [Pandoraea terrae]
MIEGRITGRLLDAAHERTGQHGSVYVTARVRANAGDGDGEAVVVNVIAFGAQPCAALRALDEGDALTVTGALTPRVWTDKQGMARPAIDLVAHRVSSLESDLRHAADAGDATGQDSTDDVTR